MGIECLEQRSHTHMCCTFHCARLIQYVCVCVCSGKSQVMGEIKIALKKEIKTEGEHLVLEILQCRNITYKFKSPDHLPGNGKQHTHNSAHAHFTTLKDNFMCYLSVLILDSQEAHTDARLDRHAT